MSIKPPIKCPPDYSILAFRLTECKKAGVVKGVTTQLAVDLQDMFVPVANYEERSITLKAGQTKKIDVSSLGVNWALKEMYTFVADADNAGLGTTHTYTLYDADNVLIESINITVNANKPTFEQALSFAVSQSTQIKELISFDASQFTGNTGVITATADTAGVRYRHVFAFDTSGFGGYWPFPYLHPGNLTTANQKYDRERVKIMMVYPDFYKSSVLSGCNCIDPSGDMKSNKKWIEYAYDDQYYQIKHPETPITFSPVLNANPLATQWTWDASSTEHLGYHFVVGDIITLDGNPLLRGVITEIQGYYVEVDTVIGNLPLPANGQAGAHVYSPNAIKWRKIGDFYLHTTAQDVLDTDYLYIETLWLRNPHQYDLPVKILLAS
jgi:hypothetical protein